MDLSTEAMHILMKFSLVNIVCFSVIEVLTSLSFRVIDKINKKFQGLRETEENKPKENP